MKPFGLSVLFLALLGLVTAQNDCFCPGGAAAPDPEKVIQLSGSTSTTCGKLQEEATKRYLLDAHGCNFYRYYGQLCGCGDPGGYQVCGLCQDGEELPDTTTLVEKTAFSVDSCQQYPLEAKFDPFKQGCGYYYYLGSLCGCSNNQPPETACTLCADGSAPPLETRQVRLPGVESGTCQYVNEYTQYILRQDSRECIANQATLGKFCGCPEAAQPVSDCPICIGGLVLSNEPAPKFSYLSPNGETTIHQSERTCLEAEMIAHELYYASQWGNQICTDLRQQLASACCKTPAELQASISAAVATTTEGAEATNNSSGTRSGMFSWFVLATVVGVWQTIRLG
ncbi:expressed unknown protein [Seminavis robusta]|uniref:Uncharacterized protein n=1 Tax=Seminavis robusta TaxID=568900 RepID=A0A9N8HCX5_9STRA|nr:expressed unknown protein [Seminavis robusta]|eukprot:Sro237_g095200.1 n/a (340) ;mRNA; f:15492-16511